MFRLYYLSTQAGGPGNVWSAGFGQPHASQSPAIAILLPNLTRTEAAGQIRAIAGFVQNGQQAYQTTGALVAAQPNVAATTLTDRLNNLADQIEHDGLGY